MELFPEGAVTTITTGFTGVVTDNIAVVLGILAFAWGIYFVMARLNKAKKGKL